jgi:hypothetical protein
MDASMWPGWVKIGLVCFFLCAGMVSLFWRRR